MKKIINSLPPFNEKKKCLNVIVETPKGSRGKYSYDHDTGLLKLTRALPQGMHFPFNFGFVPSTVAQDGDPVDVLILNEEPIVSGCLLRVRPIAVMKAEQTEEKETIRNDRVIGMAIGKETPADLIPMELTKQIAKQIEYFFVSYNKLSGKKFRVLGISGPKKARSLVRKAFRTHQKTARD